MDRWHGLRNKAAVLLMAASLVLGSAGTVYAADSTQTSVSVQETEYGSEDLQSSSAAGTTEEDTVSEAADQTEETTADSSETSTNDASVGESSGTVSGEAGSTSSTDISSDSASSGSTEDTAENGSQDSASSSSDAEEETTTSSSEEEVASSSSEEETAAEDEDPLLHRISSDFTDGSSSQGLRRVSRRLSSTPSLPSQYASYTKHYGIDVSQWQGNIDWSKVKDAGIEFAIIRVGYSGTATGKNCIDPMAVTNLRNAQAAGLKVGAYYFSQATSVAEAQQEARTAISVLRNNGISIQLPLFMDYEYAENCRMYSASHMTRSDMTSYVNAFCATVAAAGYSTGIYANKSLFYDSLNVSDISSTYAIWLAHWTTSTDYSGRFTYWQYSATGSISGISGNVDLDVWLTNDSASDEPAVEVTPHIQNIGWSGSVTDGNIAGTTGRSLRMEAYLLRLDADGYTDSNISYNSYVQGHGWQGYVSGEAQSGTTGESRAVQRISIKLSGSIANDYDVYYCVHCQNYGWLGWAKNGEVAGSDRRIEAMRVVLVKKGSAAPANMGSRTDSTAGNLSASPTIVSAAHIQNIGWMSEKGEDTTIGTVGRSLRMEALRCWLVNGPSDSTLQIRAHVQNIGWQSWSSCNGETAGTTGQGKRMEAVQIKLTGSLAQQYDIYYCVHVQNYGWLNWAKNGETAGTTGRSLRIEAIRIKLVPKGGAKPAALGNQTVSHIG